MNGLKAWPSEHWILTKKSSSSEGNIQPCSVLHLPNHHVLKTVSEAEAKFFSQKKESMVKFIANKQDIKKQVESNKVWGLILNLVLDLNFLCCLLLGMMNFQINRSSLLSN